MNPAATPKPIAVQQLREARADLERRIETALAKLLTDFTDATGLTPRDIHVRLVPVQHIAEPNPRYVLDGVRVTLDL
jgi:hypothetical protein